VKKRFIVTKLFLVIAAVLLGAASAFAIPSLQLDIAGGVYNDVDDTIVAASDPFTLYAYLIPDANTPLVGTYYISAALVPMSSVPEDLGSFTFAENTVNVTGDMTYGIPPLSSALDDLEKHGIFQTYYKEFAFSFNPAYKAAAYDMNITPGAGPTPNPDGTMYYAAFVVSTLDLNPAYAIHFDLYYPTTDSSGKPVTYNAPYSHDASSGHAPIPAAAWLLGSGLLGLVAVRRRFNKK